MFDTWKAHPGSLLWLDIESVGKRGRQDPCSKKGSDWIPDVEDGLRERHPPTFGGRKRIFLLLKILDADSKTLDFSTQQMAIFADQDFVITRHDSRSNFLPCCDKKFRAVWSSSNRPTRSWPVSRGAW